MQGSGVSALMADDLLLDLGALPFSLGPQTAAVNPGGLPTTLPFRLVMDRRTGVLSQQRNERVEQCLESAYRSGSLLGPAMDDTDIGRPYARDFLEFVLRELSTAARQESSRDRLRTRLPFEASRRFRRLCDWS